MFGWAGYGFFDFAQREFLMYVHRYRCLLTLRRFSTKPKISNAALDVDEGEPGPSKARIETITLQEDEEKLKTVSIERIGLRTRTGV